MSGSSPLAAQTNPSATRSFNTAEVAPGGAVTVTISLSDVTGNLGTVTETLPSGFAYVSSSLADAQVSTSGQDVTFTLLGQASFTYNVTASSSVGATNPFRGVLNPGNITVGGSDNVVVSASAPTPPDPAPGDGSLAVGSAVDDFGLYLTVAGENADNPNSKSITLSGSGGVFSGGDDAKAYTAMTTAPSKVGIEFASGGYSTAPPGGAVAAWWDGLSDSDKNANMVTGEPTADYASLSAAEKLEVTQAFHWDLLSGQEMYNAAYANELEDPAAYKKRFGALSATERANVEALYTAGILRRGSGNTLTATAGSGMDATDGARGQCRLGHGGR